MTLVKSVTGSMALYPMQHDKIPVEVTERIEKHQRQFIWGEQEDKRKWHAVSWKTLCKNKEEGGVGIKALKVMNDAFLMKILWRMYQRPNDLWVQVLVNKYARERDEEGNMVAKQGDSLLWKELVKMEGKFKENLIEDRRSGMTRYRWKLNENGCFTTASAYQWLQGDDRSQENQVWKRIWKLNVPERVRVFMWQVNHKRLLTRDCTGRWDGGTRQCELCKDANEDIIHALRDCKYVEEVWKKLLHYKKKRSFFVADWKNWIQGNLCSRATVEEELYWPEIFAVTCWYIWRWRNEYMHGNEFKIPWNASEVIQKAVKNYHGKWDMDMGGQCSNQGSRVSWKRPQRGWCKLNTDGAYSFEGYTGCGGVIRGDMGEWIRGFTKKLKGGNAFMAEVWGIIEGLKMCWDMGFRKIEFECDAKDVINQIEKKGTIEGDDEASMILKDMLKWDWQIKIQHVFKEGNRCADKLAKMCFSQMQSRIYWSTPPSEVMQIVKEDAEGVEIPRGLCV